MLSGDDFVTGSNDCSAMIRADFADFAVSLGSRFLIAARALTKAGSVPIASGEMSKFSMPRRVLTP